nr:MAG TPA: hypothetical protein [Caudoviricetes sp.]
MELTLILFLPHKRAVADVRFPQIQLLQYTLIPLLKQFNIKISKKILK